VSTATAYSTQVPIYCTLCPKNSNGDPPTFWKYNAFHHMAKCHMVNGGIPIYPEDMREAIHISLCEERLLGVDEEDTRSYREGYNLPDSDPPQPDSNSPEVSELLAGAPGRKRGMSSLCEMSLASMKPPDAPKVPRLRATEERYKSS
jgi:hypothetical protein